MKLFTPIIAALAIAASPLLAQPLQVEIDECIHYQTIHSFGASDCWRVQYLGEGWSLEKREKMADLLFSTECDKEGNPLGIGLSMWRFNIGAGSHEAGDASGVSSDWRRTECFLDANGNWDWSKQEGQRWFLDAARERGVPYALGFSITAPYFMTINGMTRADKENKYANLKESEYGNYAFFMANVCNKLGLDYLSPINEPQWDWVVARQEGMQATNRECSRLIHYIDESINALGADTKVVFGEAADIRYLYRKGTDRPDRDNQIAEMFSPEGIHTISHLASVAPIVSGHSYWSTWPIDTMVTTRQELKQAIETSLAPNYSYWQTEYCPMEKNDDNPNGGGKRDLGMDAALYIARVIHYDLTEANATSWQSWTAFTEADYKDGLIFIDDNDPAETEWKRNPKLLENCKTDGTCRESKYLWSFGNFSRFIRPGMVRIAMNTIQASEGNEVLYSAYIDPATQQRVILFINRSENTVDVELSHQGKTARRAKYDCYETSDKHDLDKVGSVKNSLKLAPKSIVTLVEKI